MSKLVEAKGIVKQFPGTLALNDVDFSVNHGEIVGLLGENGAGKSTLMKILSGVHQCDEGTIYIDGHETHMKDPLYAQKCGVAIVHQELSVFPNLSIAENILANRQPSKIGLIDNQKLNEKAEELLARIGVEFNVKARVSTLSVSQQQLVEIAKAISLNPKLLILDEPTSALSENEIKILFSMLRLLKEKGIGIVYTSHKIREVLEIVDRIVVLKDGEKSGEINVEDADEDKIVKMMVGRDVRFVFPDKAPDQPGNTVLEVNELRSGNKVKGLSFRVEEGRILGVFGLMGSGRTEMARAIYGLEKHTGDIIMNGKHLKINIPADAMAAGIAYLPEDRKLDGLFLDMAVKNNIVTSILSKVSKSGFLSEKLISDVTDDMVEKFRIKISGKNQKVGNLSGGNQQKVLLSKYFKANPKVLIVDEPTRGIDVGAKSEIHRLLRELANAGHAVVVISSELIEILGLSDRTIVMCDGRITGEVFGSDMTEEKIMAMATAFEKNQEVS